MFLRRNDNFRSHFQHIFLFQNNSGALQSCRIPFPTIVRFLKRLRGQQTHPPSYSTGLFSADCLLHKYTHFRSLLENRSNFFNAFHVWAPPCMFVCTPLVNRFRSKDSSLINRSPSVSLSPFPANVHALVRFSTCHSSMLAATHKSGSHKNSEVHQTAYNLRIKQFFIGIQPLRFQRRLMCTAWITWTSRDLSKYHASLLQKPRDEFHSVY